MAARTKVVQYDVDPTSLDLQPGRGSVNINGKGKGGTGFVTGLGSADSGKVVKVGGRVPAQPSNTGVSGGVSGAPRAATSKVKVGNKVPASPAR